MTDTSSIDPKSREMKLLSGTANRPLAGRIAEQLGAQLCHLADVRHGPAILIGSQESVGQGAVEGVRGLAEPTGVRYAWSGYPPVTLHNSAGLPATPFSYPEVDLYKHQPK